MKRRGLRLSRRQQWLVYGFGLALLITGIFWAWIQHLDEAGRASDSMRQIKQWLLKIHGFSAMTFVLVLGTLLPTHVRRAWHAHKNRGNGVLFLAAVGLLTFSGYALYYLGNESWRAATSKFHLWLGVAIPALLVWHTISGRRATKRD